MEEQVMLEQEKLKSKTVIYKDIPYNVIGDDVVKSVKDNFFQELNEIKALYNIYENGADFHPEGTNGDYVPTVLKFKKARKILNEEARFMFSQPMDIVINKNRNGSEKEKNDNTIVNDFIIKVLEKNNFNSNIVKAAKDCFIGKRVCIVVNFDAEAGIDVDFLNPLEFYYEMSGNDLTKLIAFFVITESTNLSDRVIRKKSFEMVNNRCFIKEGLYDGTGRLLEDENEILTDLEFIPAAIVLNDGLINDKKGESDLQQIIDDEAIYSKLASADMDSERKAMNTVKYTIDASTESTSNLSTGAGAFWDIQSDENGVEQKTAKVGQLESNMSYSDALKTTLDRVENDMFEQLSVPNINSEKLQGVITSGKTIRALYYPLQVRSDEKMLTWYAATKSIVDIIYTGALIYKDSYKYYTNEKLPEIELDIWVEANYALPEDEEEEKAVDLQEINAQVLSRKSYMKKWRGLTDEEVDEELKQIALEREILEDTFSGMMENDNQADESENDDESEEETTDDSQLEDEGIEE